MIQPEALLAAAKYELGQVKWFDANKGYGFITALDTGLDVFVHTNAIQPQQQSGDDIFRTLYSGEYVAFTKVPSGDKAPQQQKSEHRAEEVTGLPGGRGLLCDHGRLHFARYTRNQFRAAVP